MKRIYLALLFLVAITFNSCGPSLDFTYDYNENLDWTQFKTFAVAKWNPKNSDLVDDFTKERLIKGMKIEMQERGYTEVEMNPDLVVSMFIVTQVESYTTAYTTHVGGYGYYGGYYGWYRPYPVGGMETTNFVEHEKLIGTIVIDVFDEKDKKLAWQGIAKGEIKENSAPSQKDVMRLLDKMFNKYPIKQMK
jgi:hypothetical protein